MMSESKFQLGISNVQNLQLQQKQIVTQTQLITARLLEWPSIYLDEFIVNELGEHFVVGEDGDGAGFEVREGLLPEKENIRELIKRVVRIRRSSGFTSYSDEEFDYISNVSEEEDFHDHVMREFLASVRDRRKEIIGKVIIQHLDERGFLRNNGVSAWNEVVEYLHENAESLGLNPAPSEDEIEEVLKIIQSLDPPGIGARSNGEFLLAQLEYGEMEGEGVEAARKILYAFKNDDDTLAELIEKKRLDEIAYHAGLTEDEVREGLEAIRQLAPSPVSLMRVSRVRTTFSYDDTNIIKPVAVVRIARRVTKINGIEHVEEVPVVEVEWSYSRQLIVDEEAFKKLLEKFEDNPELQREFKEEFAKLEALKKVLKFADDVIVSIAKLIVEKQKEYFLTGKESALKPLTMKEIADEIGRDPSTVSRALQGKYLETPWGEVIEFSKLFPRTDNKILQIIKELIAGEPPENPYTDAQIERILNMKGFKIARRTVQKYRDMLGIPKASLRKKKKG